MTEREIMLNAYVRYIDSKATELSDVYKTWSLAKELALDWALFKVDMHYGRDARIISHNMHTFAVGAVTDTEFIYVTRAHTRHMTFREMLST